MAPREEEGDTSGICRCVDARRGLDSRFDGDVTDDVLKAGVILTTARVCVSPLVLARFFWREVEVGRPRPNRALVLRAAVKPDRASGEGQLGQRREGRTQLAPVEVFLELRVVVEDVL